MNARLQHLHKFHYVAPILAVLLLVSPLRAERNATVQNVILVTLDGLRCQELFGGADQRLINKEDGKVERPELTRQKFWDEDITTRRQKLMPFFWDVVARQGQVFGDPDHDSQVLVDNGRYFSYPGYNEILTGFADPSIDSNEKKLNKNLTVLEWLHRSPEYQGKVAAFCSWDVFPYIINEARSGIPVNAGWEPLEHFENVAVQRAYNDMARQLPRYWQSVRYDAFTFRGAYEYMKTQKPRLLYVALGETDDWAHDGRYDLYLNAARSADDFIRQLWELVKSMDTYRGKTALIISTDHGRGDGRQGWKNHSRELSGSERIWIAVMGPGVRGLGVRQGVQAVQGQVATTVAHLLGKDFVSVDNRIKPSLPLTRRSTADVDDSNFGN